jgi:DNA-binding PadR family transcriptional regulator
MKVVRLLVLGTLARFGPMHGHQLKRSIQTINVEAWSEVRAGSLYHALHQLAAEGMIELVQVERPGRLPARTVYRITSAGEAELEVLRDRALREVRPSADPFDVALWVAAGLGPERLEDVVRHRLDALRGQLSELAEERRSHVAAGRIPAVGAILMAHGEARLEAEVRWHETLLQALPSLAEGPWELPKFDNSDLSS